MSTDQALIITVLAASFAMFVWGKWRHDMVAMGALLVCVLSGLVPAGEAFLGFGHPAVITVASVLILSRGLQSSGAVDALTRVALPQSGSPLATIAALTGLAALLSGFMNNVGALALLMPVALQIAGRQGLPPGKVLMPLAFGSILGGMTTLIGTPPNLIVSSFRASTGAGSFAMFDFAPVGLAVASGGIAFVVLFGRWFVPTREGAGVEGFETSAYLTEARVGEGSKAAGMSLRGINVALQDADAQVIGLIRDEVRIPAPHPFRQVRQGDILVIEADPGGLAETLSALGLKLEEEVRPSAISEPAEADRCDRQRGPRVQKDREEARTSKAIRSDEVSLLELVVLPRSPLVGLSASDIRLRTRHGINLLALSRQGRPSMSRLRITPIAAGDVLLMQGTPDRLNDFAAQFECVPLAERALRIPNQKKAATASAIMALAVGGAALGLIPAAVAFACGALAALALRIVPQRDFYGAVDWPVIVLLAALIPVADAMARTGAAEWTAGLLLGLIGESPAVVAITLILIITMMLSDFMNNTATAAVMSPIAIQTAAQLGSSPDAFLMAVAIGASCAFLTPIGHQNNTLILGPAGFRFGDYWRLGLPLEILVVAIGVPMLVWVWEG